MPPTSLIVDDSTCWCWIWTLDATSLLTLIPGSGWLHHASVDARILLLRPSSPRQPLHTIYTEGTLCSGWSWVERIHCLCGMHTCLKCALVRSVLLQETVSARHALTLYPFICTSWSQIIFFIISQPCQIIIINNQEHWNFYEKLGLSFCDIIIDPEPRTCLKSVIVSLPPSSLPGNVDRIDEDDVIQQDFQSHFCTPHLKIIYHSISCLIMYVKSFVTQLQAAIFKSSQVKLLSLQIQTQL